jgi:hypothetical protein
MKWSDHVLTPMLSQLRLMNRDNTGYFGGLAVKKLWTPKAFNHVLQLG